MLRGLSQSLAVFFFFNDTATTEIYTLSLHDALPIFTSLTTTVKLLVALKAGVPLSVTTVVITLVPGPCASVGVQVRSAEHTSELQSPDHIVCQLLLENKISESLAVLVTVSRESALST